MGYGLIQEMHQRLSYFTLIWKTDKGKVKARKDKDHQKDKNYREIS
jgi:hypothetical protein